MYLLYMEYLMLVEVSHPVEFPTISADTMNCYQVPAATPPTQSPTLTSEYIVQSSVQWVYRALLWPGVRSISSYLSVVVWFWTMSLVSIVTLLMVILSLMTPSLSSPSETVTCRDQDGQEVDWWILYKLPKKKKSYLRKHKKHFKKKHKSPQLESYLNEGIAYVYLTSALPDTSWTLSTVSINDSESMPAKTLNKLYQEQQDQSLFSILYNDEHPHGPTSFTRGHTKVDLSCHLQIKPHRIISMQSIHCTLNVAAF